jgi:WG containing repeat
MRYSNLTKLLFLVSLVLVCTKISYAIPKCKALYPFTYDVKNEHGFFLWGYIDCKGKTIIKPKFDYATEFNNGVGIVNIDENSQGIIYPSGKVRMLHNTAIFADFAEGVTIARKNDKYFIINKNGKFLTHLPYNMYSTEYIPLTNGFSDGLASLAINGKVSFVDKIGKSAIDKRFEHSASDFSGGISAVWLEGGFRAVIDKKGNFVLPPRVQTQDYSISEASEGLVCIKEDGRWRYFNKDGKVEVDVSYDYAGNFVEGLALVNNKDKWGFINRKGKIVIDLTFDEVGDFREGLAVVRTGKDYGFINKKGKIVIIPQFDYVNQPFKNGLAYVQRNRVEGYINKKGSWIWKKKTG